MEPARAHRKRNEWERYAIVPLAVLTSNLSPEAKVLYSYADAIQGMSGKPAEGIAATSRTLNIPIDALRKARNETTDTGLLDEEQHFSEGGAESKRSLRVLHNPARKPKIINPEGVTLPAPKAKGTKASRTYPGSDARRSRPVVGIHDPNASDLLPKSRTGGGRDSIGGVVEIPDEVDEPVTEILAHSQGLRGIDGGISSSGSCSGMDTDQEPCEEGDRDSRVDIATGELLDDGGRNQTPSNVCLDGVVGTREDQNST